MSVSDDLNTKILSQGPSSDTLYILLTRMMKEGELRKVIQTCVRALEMYPSDIPIRKLLAEAFLEAGFLSQAEAEMQKVTRQITELATIYKRKAEVLAKQQRSEEALEAAQTYLAHYPDDQDALRLLNDVTPPETVISEEVSEEPEEAPLEPVPDEAEPIPETYPEPEMEEQAVPEEVTPAPPAEKATAGDAENAEDDKDGGDDGDRVREKTEQMIHTLESWLEEIRGMAEPPHSP